MDWGIKLRYLSYFGVEEKSLLIKNNNDRPYFNGGTASFWESILNAVSLFFLFFFFLSFLLKIFYYYYYYSMIIIF